MQRITDENGWRWYQHDGKKYISVTTVLDVPTHKKLKAWLTNNSKNAVKKRSTQTANIGTKIHDVIEKYVTNQDFIIDDESRMPLERFKELEKKYDIKMIESERMLISPTLGVAGQVDHVGWYTNESGKRYQCVMDIKTGFYSVKAGWQMAAYKKMLEESYGYEDLGLVGLQVHRDGSVGVPFEYSHYDWCLRQFVCALENFKGLYFTQLQKMEWPWLHNNSLDILYPQLKETK